MGFKDFLNENNGLDGILYKISQKIDLDGIILLDQKQIVLEDRNPSWREALLNAFLSFSKIKSFALYEDNIAIEGHRKNGDDVIRVLYFNFDENNSEKRDAILDLLNGYKTEINIELEIKKEEY